VPAAPPIAAKNSTDDRATHRAAANLGCILFLRRSRDSRNHPGPNRDHLGIAGRIETREAEGDPCAALDARRPLSCGHVPEHGRSGRQHLDAVDDDGASERGTDRVFDVARVGRHRTL